MDKKYSTKVGRGKNRFRNGENGNESRMEIDKSTNGVRIRVRAFNEYDKNGGTVRIFGDGEMKVSEFEAKAEGDIGFPYKLYYNQPTDLINGEGKDFMIILNTSMPYPNWYDNDKDKKKAGMSFAHFLAIPRKPLFNTVTLKKEHASLLRRMKETLLEKLKDPNFKQRVIYQVFYNIFDFPDNKKTAITPEQFHQFKSDAKTFMQTDYKKIDEMQFFLHVAYINNNGKLDGDQSIPQLHLHCLENNLRTSDIHDWKSMPLESVLNYLDSLSKGDSSNKRTYKKKTI